MNKIKSLFLNTPTNDQRIYGLQFYSLGVPLTVVIDDYVATIPGTFAAPAFEKITDNNGYWPVLLEKAFAKFYGNYNTIQSGATNKAIEILTGAPGY